jgi:hypothetical protein
MKSLARVLETGTYNNGTLNILGQAYEAKLTFPLEELVKNKGLDLTIPKTFILVPHTLPEDKVFVKNNDEQKPYLRFTIIGIVKDQQVEEKGIVNIVGKVIYENIQHEFVLVKIIRDCNYEILKLNGLLDESINQGRGSAVESMYNIKAVIDDNSLCIVNSTKIQTNNVISFPRRNTVNYYNAA